MKDVTDMDLVRRFADEHCDEAFAELVARHLNLVYSVAWRKTGNPEAVEEIV
jgi:DNA-directed RNA polymerase specialized sigma24 family protein